MNTENIQKTIFQIVQSKIFSRNLADEIKDLFSIGKSAAYRRINGETLLTTDELFRLLQQYNISLDTVLNPLATGFALPALDKTTHNQKDFLNLIERDLSILVQFPECKIRYAAFDVPFFYYILIPEVAAFKFYMWKKTIWQVKEMASIPFCFDDYLNDQDLMAQLARIRKMYLAMPSIEIWNGHMLDITLSQIQYCLAAGLFKKNEEAVVLWESTKSLVLKMKTMIESGRKYDASLKNKDANTLEVYYNELFPNNSIILIEVAQLQRVYFTFGTPNFMSSDSPNMYEHSDEYFVRMSHFSLLLNGTSDLNRHTFFNHLNRKMSLVEEDILEWVEV